MRDTDVPKTSSGLCSSRPRPYLESVIVRLDASPSLSKTTMEHTTANGGGSLPPPDLVKFSALVPALPVPVEGRLLSLSLSPLLSLSLSRLPAREHNASMSTSA